MGKPEFGIKLTCTGCAARFFDLNRVPAVCPICAAEQPPLKPRIAYSTRVAAKRWSSTPAPVAAGAAEEEDVAVDGADDLDAVDPPEVDDDDDDAADVVKPEIGVDG